jgi:hypothetical protein
MIKVMEVYEDLKETTDEVIKVFQLAGMQVHPAMVVGIANMVCLLRQLEKHKISDAAQEALTKLVKGDKFGCPIVGCHRIMPHIHAVEGPSSNV